TGMSSEEIAERLMRLCDEDDVRDKMVRITLKNVNRAAYRNIDPGKLSRLGAPALYLKIKAEFFDEQERIERPVDSHKLHEEFASFMEEEACRDQIPKAIKDDVMIYGSELIKKAVYERDRGAIDAPQ
ncbi:MAG: exonuclease SbcCD subunit D, partial [Methanotrichaceae archaeon]|nr:exonuclease SbcCD subunit D [Methanotrichaceae archaeon]